MNIGNDTIIYTIKALSCREEGRTEMGTRGKGYSRFRRADEVQYVLGEAIGRGVEGR